jgi:dCMP deaminase
MSEDWDKYFMEFAALAATKSKDDNSRYGAAIIGEGGVLRTTGFNGMARGVNEHLDYRHRRPYKYYFYEHAERNAIYNAARSGIQTLNCTMYMLEPPCADCAKAIIQAGIKSVVIATKHLGTLSSTGLGSDQGDWTNSVAHGSDQLEEAGVVVRYLS